MVIERKAQQVFDEGCRRFADRAPKANSKRVAGVLRQQWEDACMFECESPIERILLAALIWTCDVSPNLVWCPGLLLPMPSAGTFIVPQYKFSIDGKPRRADFALVGTLCDHESGGLPKAFACVLIECDGHDFHEKTKLQASRDKARDRSIQTSGLNIFRFSGSDIFREPWQCASESISQVKNIVDREDSNSWEMEKLRLDSQS